MKKLTGKKLDHWYQVNEKISILYDQLGEEQDPITRERLYADLRSLQQEEAGLVRDYHDSEDMQIIEKGLDILRNLDEIKQRYKME